MFDICNIFVILAARKPTPVSWGLIATALGVAAGIYGLRLWLAAWRQGALADFAQAKGFSFLREAGGLLQSEWDDFWLFNRGRDRRTFNVLGAKLGRVDVLIFDYEFRTHYRRNSYLHRHTVVAFASDSLLLPRLKIRPLGFWGRVFRGFYDPGLPFPDAPEFNRHYCVEAPSETRARMTLTPAVQAKLLERTGWWVETKMNWVCASRIHGPGVFSNVFADSRPTPGALMEYAGDALEIFQALAPETQLVAAPAHASR